MFHNTEKTETRQWKCATSLIRRQNNNGEVVDRSWLCFSPSQTCIHCLACRFYNENHGQRKRYKWHIANDL